MLIRLTRKLAERLDGVDLSSHRVGQIINLSDREAALVIAEGWAVSAETDFNRVTPPAAESAAAPPSDLLADPAARRRAGS